MLSPSIVSYIFAPVSLLTPSTSTQNEAWKPTSVLPPQSVPRGDTSVMFTFGAYHSLTSARNFSDVLMSPTIPLRAPAVNTRV